MSKFKPGTYIFVKKIGTLCVHVSAKRIVKAKSSKCHALKIRSTQIIFKQDAR